MSDANAPGAGPSGPGGCPGRPYDAVLLVSFGGPERPEDVVPFLENVTRGRNVPRERLAEVAKHYYAFRGSPINDQCRELRAAISSDFAAHGLDLPVYWGNRNWHPQLTDTLRRMADDGIWRAAAFVTAAYSSYSSCRQYREDMARAQQQVGPGAPRIDKLRHYFNHPGFIEPMVRNTRDALASLPARRRARAHLAFTAHSIPTIMAQRSGPAGGAYVRQLTEAARLIRAGVGGNHPYSLAFQSRSGPSSEPWLQPDVCDHLDELTDGGTEAVVVVPVGFVSDHLEVLHDLDMEAARRAAQRGLGFARAATPGTDARFVAMVRELLLERSGEDGRRPVLGRLGPSHDYCPARCCPNLWGPAPAAAGA